MHHHFFFLPVLLEAIEPTLAPGGVPLALLFG
jgi:hypothetical protein